MDGYDSKNEDEMSSYASKIPFVEWAKQHTNRKKLVDIVNAENDRSTNSSYLSKLFQKAPSETIIRHHPADGITTEETTVQRGGNNFRTTKVLHVGGKRRRHKTVKRRRRKTVKRHRRKTVKKRRRKTAKR